MAKLNSPSSKRFYRKKFQRNSQAQNGEEPPKNIDPRGASNLETGSANTPRQARPQPSVHIKIMDMLARRDHSEKEVRQKLKGKFTQEEIEVGVARAREAGWIPNSPEDLLRLSEKVAESLRRRGKGPKYISQFLRQKGLVEVANNPQEELEKAIELVENKFFKSLKKSAPDRAKVGRFLMSRGFSSDVIRKVIYGSTFKF